MTPANNNTGLVLVSTGLVVPVLYKYSMYANDLCFLICVPHVIEKAGPCDLYPSNSMLDNEECYVSTAEVCVKCDK